MERIWVIVPIKPLAQAKSRLAPVLAPDARRRLVLTMLHHTLSVLTRVEDVAGTLVISADETVALVAAGYDATFLPEPQAPGLNASLTRATAAVQKRGATGVLVVPGDLPHINVSSVEAFLSAAPERPAVVIAPDRRERGTNLLLLIPPDIIPFSYGPDSFERHLARAEASGVHPVICRMSKLAIDTDLPEDLALIDEEMYLDRS